MRDALVALDRLETALAAPQQDPRASRAFADAQRVDALWTSVRRRTPPATICRARRATSGAILEIKPDYAPERAVTSKKAMARFVKIQAAHDRDDPADAWTRRTPR